MYNLIFVKYFGLNLSKIKLIWNSAQCIKEVCIATIDHISFFDLLIFGLLTFCITFPFCWYVFMWIFHYLDRPFFCQISYIQQKSNTAIYVFDYLTSSIAKKLTFTSSWLVMFLHCKGWSLNCCIFII